MELGRISFLEGKENTVSRWDAEKEDVNLIAQGVWNWGQNFGFYPEMTKIHSKLRGDAKEAFQMSKH